MAEVTSGEVTSTDASPTPPREPDDESIGRSALLSFLGRGVSAAFTAALTLFLVRKLSPAEYGVFALTIGISDLVLLPADAGLSGAGVRFVAEHRGDSASLTRLVSRITRLKGIAVTAIAAALFAAAGPIANAYDTPSLAWPLRVVSIAMAGQSFFGFYVAAFMAVRRAGFTFRLLAVESAIEFSASVAFVLIAGGATAAVAGRSAGYACGAVIGWIVVRRFLRSATSAKRPAQPGKADEFPSLRRLLHYAGALAVINAVTTAMFQVDLIIIGAVLGATAVGIFQAPLKLTLFLAFPALAAAKAVAPRLAKTVGGGGGNTEAFAGAIRIMLIAYAIVIAPLIVWAQPITNLLLGSDFHEAARVVQLLTPYMYLLGVATLLAEGATYFGEARLRLIVSSVALVVNAGLDFVLLHAMGVSGASLATDAGFIILVLGLLWICHREVDLALAPVAITCLRSLIAAGVSWLLLELLGGTDMSAATVVAAVILTPPVFAGVLLLTREVKLDELAALKPTLAGWWHRLAGARSAL
jgi:O-antigen/teichoic acid export membrane protein